MMFMESRKFYNMDLQNVHVAPLARLRNRTYKCVANPFHRNNKNAPTQVSFEPNSYPLSPK